MVRASTAAAMSSISPSVRSGAILRKIGVVRPPPAGRRVARGDDAGQQVAEFGPRLHGAQARRVGRGDVDGEIGGERREAADAELVVGGAVGAVLVGADVDADDAWPAARAASRACAARRGRSLLKPSRLITAPSRGRRKMRGFGLPACGRGRDRCRPRRSRNRAPAARRAPRRSCRSPPPCRADWGRSARRPSTASRGSVFGAATVRQAELQRRDRQAVRRLGVERGAAAAWRAGQARPIMAPWPGRRARRRRAAAA